MNNTNSLVASTAEQIGEAANEFFAAISRGEEPSIAQFSERYPEIAEHIRRTFPALLLVGNCSTDGDQRELRPHSDGSKTLGDFRLVREIGRGGMGTVFEAEQISMGRHVALKVLPFAALVHQSSLQRFRNEVRAAAALNHPNIVPVYFIGEERGVHFYAMQLIRGQTLADMIHVLRKAHQPASALNINASANDETPTIDSATVPPATKRVEQARISTVAESRQAVERYRTAARLGIEAAEALQHAHDQGVLHRDIKPSNLLLDGDGKLYVTDFGLARIEADAGMTMTGDIVGTLRYMAPEQALAKRVVIDHRADIYSLGATLYELLTLQPAFGETDRSELLKQIAFEEPRLLRKLDRRIPAELETIVLRAMAKNPDERYQTAQQLADDLRAFLENRPIKAKPPTWREQITKWSRRHPAAVWAGALFLVSTTLVSSASIVLVANAYKREAIARSAAEAQVRREGEIFKKVRLSMNDMLVAPAVGKGIWVELPSSMREEFAKKAFQYYESLMQEESSDPSLQFETAVTCWLLGSMQVSLKQYQPAEKLLCRSTAILERLCRDYPADYSYRQQLAKSNSMLGATLFAEGQLVEAGAPTLKAIELYKSLIREGPDLAAYVPELGIAYKRLGQLRRKQGESTKEMSDEYLALLRHAVARGPQYGNIHNALAFKLDEKGLGDDALAAEREAVRLEPHETTWRENLSYFLNKQGRFDESIATLEEGIQLDPDAAALHNNLGTALANKGLIDKSITEYRTAIRLNPKHPMFRRNLGESLVEKAQQNEAIAEQVECLRLPPLDAAPHYRFADAFGRALEQKAAIEEALATCQAGLQFEPRDVKLLNAVGEIFLQKGSYDEAIATFRKAIQLEPNALGYSNLGLALQRKGQLDEAVHSMREAVRLDPNDATAHHNLSLFLNDLGAELKSKGRLDEAISNAREAVQLAPNDALAHRNLGIFLNDRGRLNEAMVQYHEAIRLDPADAQTYELLGVILHQKGRPGEAIEKLK